jgi:hypothetical protein
MWNLRNFGVIGPLKTCEYNKERKMKRSKEMKSLREKLKKIGNMKGREEMLV